LLALSIQLTAHSSIPPNFEPQNLELQTTSNFKLFLSFEMKTKECPSCAMEVDINSKVCPICKYQFTRQQTSLKWAAMLLALLFLIYLIFF